MAEEKKQKLSPEEKQMKRREARRRRRIRNEIIAYIVVAVVVAAIGIGSINLVKAIVQLNKNHKQQEAVAQAQKEFEELEAKQEEESNQQEDTSNVAEEVLQEPELSEEELAAQRLDEVVNAAIAVMPIEDKVAGLFIVTPEAITGVDVAVKAGDGTKEALGKNPVGGLVYSKSNINSEDQFKEMLKNTSLYVSYPTFLAIAEEGGDEGALASAGLGNGIGSQKQIGEAGDPGAAYSAGCSLGASLTALGINLNMAPVADINVVDGNILGNRCYGNNADSVTTYVTNMVQGLSDYGVNSCIKYFPGLGSVNGNPAEGAVMCERSAEELRAEELAVYQAVLSANGKMVMMSNASYTALDGEGTPAGLSNAIVSGVLRGELGFDGVVVTGYLTDKAVTDKYGSGEAAIAAINAGCDMLLCPANYQEAVSAVLGAISSGELSSERIDASLRRIYRIKYADKVDSAVAGE